MEKIALTVAAIGMTGFLVLAVVFVLIGLGIVHI
jgi:hypothetical protein